MVHYDSHGVVTMIEYSSSKGFTDDDLHTFLAQNGFGSNKRTLADYPDFWGPPVLYPL
jgi:hypothetical protein